MVQPRDAYGRFVGRGGPPIQGTPAQVQRQSDDLFDAALSHVTRRLQLRAFQILTSETPRDKGTAVSGWTPTAGSPALEPITAPSDDGEARSIATQRFSENQAKAEQLARSYTVRQGPAFLANAVPWIVPLNAGSSSQAPSMFVERGLELAVRTVNL